MCKSIAEGGLRCAAHTRKGYIAAIKPVLEGEKLTPTQVSVLYTTATAYASTPKGQEAVQADIEHFTKKRNKEIVNILSISAKNGEESYLNAKEATAIISNEVLRQEVTEWAAGVPVTSSAKKDYIKLLASDLDASEAEVVTLLTGLEEDARNGLIRKANKSQMIRFLSLGANNRVGGTPTTPEFLDAIAEVERRAGEVRSARRMQIEPVEKDGTRWLKYENDAISEIVRAVKYNRDTRTAYITIAPKGGEMLEYYYEDVDPKIIRALVSARSMGGLYAYIFASRPNGGTLENQTTHQYSYAIHAANKVFPIQESHGPVPRKYATDFGFGKTAQAKVVAKKATVKKA